MRGLLLIALLSPGIASAEETLAMLLVDGRPVGDEPRMLDPNAIFLPASEWVAMGAALPANLAKKYHLTAAELSVVVNYDASKSEVRLSLPSALRPGQTLGARRSLPSSVSPMPRGLLLDYDVAALSFDGSHRLSMGHTARVGVGGGVFSTTGQVNWIDGNTDYRRGLTRWQRDFLGSGTTLSVGDVAVPAGGVSNPALLGGVRFGTDRGLTRYGGAFDIPTIGGLADTRSTAEVFINEQRRVSGEIEAGPYTIDRGVSLPGLNVLQLVQRDAFGREAVVSRSFYTHADLLGKGTTEWGVVAGAVRPKANEDNYEGWATAGNASWGMSDRWTVGAGVQTGARDGVSGRNFTISNTVSLGAVGLIQAHVAASETEGVRGNAYRATWERRSQDWSASVSHLQKDASYWDISTLQDRSLPIEKQTTASLAFHPRGSQWRGNLSYTAIEAEHRDYSQVGASLSYRRPGMVTTGSIGRELTRGDTQAQVSMRLNNSRGGQTAYTARTAPVIGQTIEASYSGAGSLLGHDVRYQVAADGGDVWSTYGRLQGNVAGGDASVEIRTGSLLGTMVSGSYRNSVWLGEGGVINGRGHSAGLSFAVIEVPEQPGMLITGGQRPLTTNKRGYAFMPTLGTLTASAATIGLDALPLDVSLDTPRVEFVPARNAGAKVRFGLHRSTTKQYEVWIEDHYAPEGAIATSDAGEQFTIGDRGVLVLDQPAKTAWVKTSAGKCELVLPDAGGMVICRIDDAEFSD